MRKSEAEIEALKRNWHYDPIWDIEETEGFEDHKEELKAYREQVSAEYEQKEHTRLSEKAAMFGIPGKIELVRYIETLEFKIDRIQESIAVIDRRVEIARNAYIGL